MTEGASLDAALADVAPGARVARRPFPYATSHRLEEVELTRPGRGPTRLVAKHLGRRQLTGTARRAKPITLYRADREAEVYGRVLRGADLGTPELIADVVVAGSDERVLVLEEVAGVPLWETGDPDVWRSVARWLARTHRRFDGGESSAWAPSALLRYDADLLAAAGTRGLVRVGNRAMRAAMGQLHIDAVAALAAEPLTLVHGDFYPSNVVVAGDRVAVIDWELAGVGPGLLDLAAFVSGRWTDQERLDLVAAYHAELGRPAPPRADFLRLVDLAALHVALAWAGRESEWAPPDEHLRDWLADAHVVAARLGVRP